MGKLSYSEEANPTLQALHRKELLIWLQPSEVETVFIFIGKELGREQSPPQVPQNRSSELNLSPSLYLSRKILELAGDGQYHRTYHDEAVMTWGTGGYDSLALR